MQVEALLIIFPRACFSHRAGMEMHVHVGKRGGGDGDGFLTSTQEDFSGLF